MVLAFVLFKYFPFGGLQRDFLKIALECQKRGAQIKVFCISWQGDIPSGFEVNIIKIRAVTNHRKNYEFAKKLQQEIKQHKIDKIIGFNKVPDLDFYYAADDCYAEKVEDYNWLMQLTPRVKTLLNLEREVFAKHTHTKILMLTPKNIAIFTKYYATDDMRFCVLPPGIEHIRIRPNNYLTIRQNMRSNLQIADDKLVILQVGSGFKTKGLDRSLIALANLPNELKYKVIFLVVGQDKPHKYLKQAQNLGIDKQVLFLGGRNDITQLMVASDVLLHPAYRENAGMVLLEGLCAGLPIITTSVCGYAHYINEACGGLVLDEPFAQKQLNTELTKMLKNHDLRVSFGENGAKFAQNADIFSMAQKCADIILG